MDREKFLKAFCYSSGKAAGRRELKAFKLATAVRCRHEGLSLDATARVLGVKAETLRRWAGRRDTVIEWQGEQVAFRDLWRGDLPDTAPAARRAHRAARRAHGRTLAPVILERLQAGERVAVIARDLGVTRAYVYQVKSKNS